MRAGEILGLAGLVGSGRTETLRLLFGADRAQRGTVEVDGVTLTHLTPRRGMAAGIALVPESRKEEGLVMVRSLRENVALASLGDRRLGPLIRRSSERSAVDISNGVGAPAPARRRVPADRVAELPLRLESRLPTGAAPRGRRASAQRAA